MTVLPRALAALAVLILVAPLATQAQVQTPITVQVINDSTQPDSTVNLMVVGQDVGNTPAGAPGTYAPFSVSGVSAVPVGLVVNATSALSTAAGSISAANAPLMVTANASPILATFMPATIAASTDMSTLTITLPDNGVAPASTLVQPFVVTMPPGVTINAGSSSGTCPSNLLAISTTRISIGIGLSIPQYGCTIAVTVMGSNPGAVAMWTSYLQTGTTTAPAAAPLNVVAATSGLVASSFTPSTIAVGAGNNATLTITIPNVGNPTTLTAPFTSTMPPAVQVVAPFNYTNTCTSQTLTVTATQITLPTGTSIPSGGCVITATVTSIATASALSQMNKTGTTIISPYTGQSRTVYSFTMATVSSGSLYVSYNQPVTYPSAPTVRTGYRFQPLEFSYANGIASNGDLTSIDFFGIPLELQTFGAADTAQQYPLDRVTYYTSTAKLMREFARVNPNLSYAFIGTNGQPFQPTFDSNGNINNFASFARIVGPNQIAAGGTPSLISYPASPPANWTDTWPPVAGSPWPYGSFADYLDSLVSAKYTFTESDNVNISAYTFTYTGSITGNRTSGYTITLTGSTGTKVPPSPLSANATVTLFLPPQSTAGGGYDFAIYGVPQNCNTLQVAGFTCVPATAAIPAVPAIPATPTTPAVPAVPAVPANPGNVTDVTNSVYGWIQADVISALNFGYMNGKADADNGGGQSSVWYGLPPVQYPFGQARPNAANGNTDDGFYNAWAALMYNHSDAYGFAFSDRKGRPSPDIGFPIGGTLRVWILPDERLDAPMAAVTASDTSSITLQWPAVNNATSYTVTWSPPYQTASMQVPPPNPDPGTVIATIPNLQPGTPYTFTVRAYGINAATQAPIQSFELPVYARTQGTTPVATTGNAQFQFGFNWAAPAYMTAGAASTWPTLQLAGQSATYPTTGTTFTIPLLTGITVGPPPASTALTVTPGTATPSLYITEAITPGTAIGTAGSTATMTVTLGNNTVNSVVLSNGMVINMPAGVAATQTTANTQATTCGGATTIPASGENPSMVVLGQIPILAGGCTVVVTLTSSTPGTVIVNVPSMVVAGVTPSLPASAPLVIPGDNPIVTQTITPPTINLGGQATLSIAFGNATGAPTTLIEPFVMSLPAGVTIADPGASNAGTCAAANVVLSATQIAMPAGTTIASGGCTIVTNITSNTPGTTTITTGALLTTYPTQSFPLELAYNGSTIWSANVYLTMLGTPGDFSVGPCLPTDNCAGSGLPNTVPFDTLLSPNFMERSGAAFAIAGGAATAGPPFALGVNTPTVGISFTPVANKKYAKVRAPN